MNKYLDALENVIETHYDKHDEDTELVRKGLKALEIIKERTPNVKGLLESTSNVNYNRCYLLTKEGRELTKDEYNLLKEVLTDE